MARKTPVGRKEKNDNKNNDALKRPIDITEESREERIERIEKETHKLETRAQLIKHVANNILQENIPEIRKQTEELSKETKNNVKREGEKQ